MEIGQTPRTTIDVKTRFHAAPYGANVVMRAWFYRHAAPVVLGAIGNVGISLVCFSGSAVNYPRFTLTLHLGIPDPLFQGVRRFALFLALVPVPHPKGLWHLANRWCQLSFLALEARILTIYFKSAFSFITNQYMHEVTHAKQNAPPYHYSDNCPVQS
jgi:hypothetical protein